MQENALHKARELQDRTKQLAVRIIRMFRALPKTDEARVIGKQLLRSGTSVAANYRAACRARSKAEFAAKISIVLEEIDETVFWMERWTGGYKTLPYRTGLVRRAQAAQTSWLPSSRLHAARLVGKRDNGCIQ